MKEPVKNWESNWKWKSFHIDGSTIKKSAFPEHGFNTKVVENGEDNGLIDLNM